MSTALEARPAPSARDAAAVLVPARHGGLMRRVGSLRRTSPGRLQLLTAILLTLGLLTGLVAGLTGYATSSGTTDLGNRAQPLLVEAETIYSALADANTTANQAFLAGGLEPPELTRRYDADLARATTALAAAARRTPEGSDAADAISALSTGIARYAALVATARATNRQNLPVGASYLSVASQDNQALLTQAQSLFRNAQREVNDGYGTARSVGWLTLLFLLLIVLLVALVAGQRYLSRTTHRTFNVPLVGATVLTLVLTLAAAGLLTSQNTNLHQAATQGSQPASQLAEARILALRERGDEALTLAAHSSDDKDSKFAAADAELSAALTNDFVSTDTRDAYATYVAQHRRIRALDTGGSYDDAVKLAVGPETTDPFEQVKAGLDTSLERRKAVFTEQIGAAGRGLGLFTVLGPLLALIICALAFAGIRSRLEEYR
ncbi:hypothetical protein ACWKSP_34665 [Micromonosporaceae bacterium Da 78-11]